MRTIWRRFAASRRASFGFNAVLIFGTPVLLHVFAGIDYFANEAGWYWAYAAVAWVGVWLVVSGLRAAGDACDQPR